VNKIVLLGILFSSVLYGQTGLTNHNTDDNTPFWQGFSERLSGSFESNAQWYQHDPALGDFYEEGKDPEGEERLRANSYLKLDYRVSKNVSVGIQAESYLPMSLLNYAPSLDQPLDLALYYANYRNKFIDITAGYFYEQYGSGLLLRAWEDRQLGINNALRGGRIVLYPSTALTLRGFWGQQRVGFGLSEAQMFGADSQLDLTEIFNTGSIAGLSLGFSYLGKQEDYVSEQASTGVPSLVHSFSGRFDLDLGRVYTSLEYVSKGPTARLNEQGEVVEGKTFGGNAFLWNLGYAQKGFAVQQTFRRMEGMRFFAERTAAGSDNLYNEQVINYLPALTKQHDYSLANIYVYQTQPGLHFLINRIEAGEIGSQTDIFYKLKKGTWLGGRYGAKIALNLSYWAGLDVRPQDPENTGGFGFSDATDYSTSFWRFGQQYYRDFNIELRKKWSPQWQSIFAYIDTYYDKKYIEDTRGVIRARIGIAEATRKLGNGRSLRMEMQHLWSRDDHKNWWAGTLEYHASSRVSFFLADMLNYGHEAQRIHYFNLGGSYSKNSTRIALNYGRQRGGLLCVGGVCRLVTEAAGLGFSISTAF